MTARCRWLTATCLLLAPLSAALPAEPRIDCFGDPLPDGVALRMGTVRFRHSGDLGFVGFLPDGKTILSTGKDDAMRWWDAASGKELRRWTAPAALGCAAASPDRRVLAVEVGDDVVLWDAVSGKELWKLHRPDQRLGAIAFSPDRKLVATCGERIWLWDAVTGERVREMDAYGRGLYTAVTFLPDAKTLVSTARDGTLRWWDVETGKETAEVDAYRSGGCCLAVSPDGSRLATTGGDHALRLWDAEKRTETRLIEPAATNQQAVSLAFSPDGKRLAAGCGDGAIRLYDAADGALLWRCEGHQDAVSALAFSANGGLLVSGGADCTVRQWDVVAGKEIRPFAGSTGLVWALAVSPDGKTVASAGIDRRVHLWDADSGEERRSLDKPDGDAIALLGFSPNGRSLTAVGRGGGGPVLVWDVADGKRRSAFSLVEKHYPEALALSPDGALAAAFGQADGFAVFDVTKGEIISNKETDRRRLQAGAFLDGKTLALFRHADGLSTRYGSLLLWDAVAGTGDVVPLKSEPGAVFWAVASPDGKMLAAVSSGGLVWLWSVSTGEVVGWINSGSDFVLGAAFSADGRMLATSALDGSVSVWEIASASRRCQLKGGQGYIDALAFSPDGRRLYTGGHNGTVLAWDLTELTHEGAPSTDLDEKALDRLWDELGAGDASQSYGAMWKLAAAPKRSAPFLKAHLVRAVPTPAAILRRLADLDSDDFETRERASASLRWFDEAMEPALAAALSGQPSPEARRRIEELLEWIHKARVGVHPPDARIVRAIEALENAGAPEARAVLADLADGPSMSLTREAKAALERMRRRSPDK